MKEKQLLNAVGSYRGTVKDKNNRAQRIIKEWDSIEKNLKKILVSGDALSKESRLAYGMLLILNTGMRVGNLDSAEGFKSKNKKMEGKVCHTYGMTTMKSKHIEKDGDVLRIKFVGKKLVVNEYVITDDLLVKYYNKMVKGLKSEDSFIGHSSMVAWKFVRKYIDKSLSPKDFRTAFANKRFAKYTVETFTSLKDFTKKSAIKRFVNTNIKMVAGELCHTPAICKRSYISPNLINTVVNYIS